LIEFGEKAGRTWDIAERVKYGVEVGLNGEFVTQVDGNCDGHVSLRYVASLMALFVLLARLRQQI
jgi:hypothetical protein